MSDHPQAQQSESQVSTLGSVEFWLLYSPLCWKNKKQIAIYHTFSKPDRQQQHASWVNLTNEMEKLTEKKEGA